MFHQEIIRQFGRPTTLKVSSVKRVPKMTNDHKYIGNNKKPQNCFQAIKNLRGIPQVTDKKIESILSPGLLISN